MRWPAFLSRRRAAANDPVRSVVAAQIDEALARRKAGRAERRDRARRSAATNVHQQIARDPLLDRRPA